MLRLSLTLAKFSLGSLTLIAIFLQFQADTARVDFSAINFFSFFTIQSNLLAAVSLLVTAIFLFRKTISRNLDLFRGGVLVYMIITGLVYKVLLADLPDTTGTTIAWVNNLFHYVLPTALIIDWLLNPPSNKLNYKDIILWFIFPIIYISYSLIRGALTGWYPYDFLNPATNGVFGIVQYIVTIGLGVMVLSTLTVWISKLRVK